MPSHIAHEIVEYYFKFHPYDNFDLHGLSHSIRRIMDRYMTERFDWKSMDTNESLSSIEIFRHLEKQFPLTKSDTLINNRDYVIRIILVVLTVYFYPKSLSPFSKEVYLGRTSQEHSREITSYLNLFIMRASSDKIYL